MAIPRHAWVRGSVFLVAACLALVALADWLFYERPAGWSVGLFLAALLLAVGVRGGEASRATRILFLALGGLVLASIEEPGPLTDALAIVGLITLAISLRIGWTSRPVLWLQRWWRFAVRGSWQFARDLYVKLRRHARKREGFWPVIRWVALWSLPVVLSLVFVGLFWLANPVIERWIEAVRRQLDNLYLNWSRYVGPGRVLLWLLVGAWSWSLLRTRPRRVIKGERDAALAANVLPDAGAESNLPGAIRRHEVSIVVRCLAMFNLVFAVQTALDLVYLFGGAELPAGVTLAHYAHRGAYPLIATALLAAAFVLVTFRGRGAAERSAWARRLVYLWIGQNVFLVLTAAWRLGLYIEAYSLTRWRVATAVWMLLVALGLVWIVIRILAHRDNAWLLKANVLTAAVVLYACCFPNIDGFIAWYNVKHCREIDGRGAPIDIEYLGELGPEAIPALSWLANELGWFGQGLPAHAQAIILRAELERDMSDWRGWTWRRERIARGSGALPVVETARR